MVWGEISQDADPVLVENGSLMAHHQIQEILAEHILPFAPFIDENSLLMQENACPYVA